MADNQSPELTASDATAGTGAAEQESQSWQHSIARPSVPVVPLMLPAVGAHDPAPQPARVAPEPLHSSVASLPTGLEEHAVPRLQPVVTAAGPVAAPAPLPTPAVVVVDPWPAPIAPSVEVAARQKSHHAVSRVWRIARHIRTAVKWAALAFVAWFALTIGLIALYRFVNPPFSMLILGQRLTGVEIDHTWVPLDRISPNLRRAVITSEDGKFCHHWGFDFGEIRAALQSGENFGRGASTITQQVAKNMFLWPGKSYVRKALEVPITLVIEGLWPKRRIFEVYLNIAEWGPGVFGAEAASQHAYSHSAAELSEREAALLAVALPNPIARDIADPESGVARLATRLQSRMRMPVTRGCVSTRAP